LSLAYLNKRMLFELLPDYFPPFLSNTEIRLWELYFAEMSEEKRKNSGR